MAQPHTAQTRSSSSDVAGVKFSTALTSRSAYWRDWTVNVLVHLFPPNIYQTIGQSLASFDYMAEASSLSPVSNTPAHTAHTPKHARSLLSCPVLRGDWC